MVDWNVEQTIMFLLRKKFSERIWQNAIFDSKLLSSAINKNARSNEDKKIQIESAPDGGEISSIFRINFKLPVYLLNDKSFNEIRRACLHGHYRHNDKVVSMSSLTPVYNLNLNHITAIREYGMAAIQGHTDNITEETSDFACKKYALPKTKSPRKMQMSSMNFLLKGDTKEEPVDELWSEAVRRCYRYLCWNPPLDHFDLSTIHSLFIHSSKRIFGIAKIYKTIAKIEKINKDRRDEFLFANTKYDVADATVNMIFQDKEKIFARHLHIWIAEPHAQELEPGDLVNCLVVSPVVYGGYMKYKTMPPIIMGIAGKIKNSFVTMGSLVGMFTWKKNQKLDENTELTKVSGSDELFDDIWSFMEKNRSMFDLDMHDARDNFDKYIEMGMFFLRDSNGSIWQVPTTLWALMIDNKMHSMGTDELSIFNRDIPDEKSVDWMRKLRYSTVFDRIQRGPRKRFAGDLLYHFPRIANRMVYSRLISKSSTDASLR